MQTQAQSFTPLSCIQTLSRQYTHLHSCQVPCALDLGVSEEELQQALQAEQKLLTPQVCCVLCVPVCVSVCVTSQTGKEPRPYVHYV